MALSGKVDFIICGAQKSGTTALYEYLKEHPEICMPLQKELHFFDKESHFSRDKPDYTEYHNLFFPRPPNRLLGEATPIYMYWQSAPRRIRDYNRHMKLIVLLRNPIERAFSHWNMERSRVAESLSFEEALQQEDARCKAALPEQHRVYSYVDRGFYLLQLKRLWRYFPQDQILVLKAEDLKNEPQPVLGQIWNFLGVRHIEIAIKCDVHSLPYESQMSPQVRSYLRSKFEDEIGDLERVLGWDCSSWLKG